MKLNEFVEALLEEVKKGNGDCSVIISTDDDSCASPLAEWRIESYSATNEFTGRYGPARMTSELLDDGWTEDMLLSGGIPAIILIAADTRM